jgi:hypothetical protein
VSGTDALHVRLECSVQEDGLDREGELGGSREGSGVGLFPPPMI